MILTSFRIGNSVNAIYHDDLGNEKSFKTKITGLDKECNLGEGWAIMVDLNEDVVISHIERMPISNSNFTVLERMFLFELNSIFKVDPIDNRYILICNNNVVELQYIDEVENFYYSIKKVELELNL